MERERKVFNDDINEREIHFDIDESFDRDNGHVSVIFRLSRKNYPYFTEKDLEILEKDLKDLGKFRIIKQGKRFLED